MVFFREAVKRAGGSHSDQSSRLAYWMRRFSVIGRRAVTVALDRCVRPGAYVGGHWGRPGCW